MAVVTCPISLEGIETPAKHCLDPLSNMTLYNLHLKVVRDVFLYVAIAISHLLCPVYILYIYNIESYLTNDAYRTWVIFGFWKLHETPIRQI